MQTLNRLTLVLLALACTAPLTGWAEPVNINTADARTIAKELKGIGVARAQAIVAHRTQNGPFKSADDLGRVKGIAQKVIDQNRANIRVDGRVETARAPASASKPEGGKPAAPRSTKATDSMP